MNVEEGDTVTAEIETVLGGTRQEEMVVDAVDDDGVYSINESPVGESIRFVPWEAFDEEIWTTV